jgi:hypothetical protein
MERRNEATAGAGFALRWGPLDLSGTTLGHWLSNLATNRTQRVAYLLVTVALVSAADLYLTLHYLTTTGMAEGNPIARLVMSFGQSWILGVWKFALVTFTLMVIWTHRKRVFSECAAWFCALVMGWLCVQWYDYTKHVAEAVTESPELMACTTWVAFTPGDAR